MLSPRRPVMDARLAGSERLSKTATQNWRIEPEGSDSVWSMYFEGGFRLTKYEMRMFEGR